MSKPKIPLNMINAKFPNISEICVTYKLFKKKTRKWLKRAKS